MVAVDQRHIINLLEQPPRRYTPVVALTPFRSTVVVALVGATVIQEGVYKARDTLFVGEVWGRHGFSHGS